MMTILVVLVVINAIVSLANMALLILRRMPAPSIVDPAAVARAILSTPFNASDVHEAMDVARPAIQMQAGSAKALDHHVVQHTDGGVTKVLYEGHSYDRAVDAHLEMERNPDAYPGRHQLLTNGRARVDRHHTEIER
jgi:hypothetical protein